jgi:nickel/cobalt exporter
MAKFTGAGDFRRPVALILLLSAVALQQVGFGIILIVAFSIGLAAVLTGIGLALVYAGRLFEKIPVRRGRFLTRLLPMASALFISVAGLIIMWQALVETL